MYRTGSPRLGALSGHTQACDQNEVSKLEVPSPLSRYRCQTNPTLFFETHNGGPHCRPPQNRSQNAQKRDAQNPAIVQEADMTWDEHRDFSRLGMRNTLKT